MDLIESGSNRVPLDGRHPWELARLEVIKRVLRERVDLHAGDLVLDVGCGDSFMAEQIASAYPAVTFCAIDTALDEQLLGTFTGTLTVGNLRLFRTLEEATVEMRGRQAALVLLLDVIEHVADDVAFLKNLQASSLVNPRALYVVSVPAFEFLFSMHDVVLGHHRRYSNNTLQRHLMRAGLEPELLCYFFSSLLLPRLTQAATEKLLGKTARRSTQVARWRGGKLLQRLMKKILVWDFSISWALYRRGVILPGLSNLAVCRRPA
jgi:SAM-dependent methyltransferase